MIAKISIVTLMMFSFSSSLKSNEIKYSTYSAPIAKPINAKIFLKEEVSITVPKILLKEIAFIESDDPTLKKQLESLVIDFIQWNTSNKVISSYKVKRALIKEGLENVQVHGLKSFVSIKYRQVTKDEIANIVNIWLNEKVSQNLHIKIDIDKAPLSWTVPDIDDILFEIEENDIKVKKFSFLTIKAMYGDSTISKQRIKINMDIFKETIVVNSALSRGDAITENFLEKRMVNVDDLDGTEFYDSQQVIDMILTKNLNNGDVIKKSHLEKPIITRKGSLNQIIVINGSLNMNISEAIAMQDGKKGDKIMFKNPLNKNEPIYAEVIENGKAKIVLR